MLRPRPVQRIPRPPAAVPGHRCLFRVSSLADRLAYLSTSVLLVVLSLLIQVYQPFFLLTFPAFGSLCTFALCIVAVPSFDPSASTTHCP